MNFLLWVRTQWDRVGAWAFIGLGGLAVVLGWVGAGKQALTAQQIPYIISGGVGGLFLLGVGAMLWLSADLRDEWRKLDEIHRDQSRPDLSFAAGPDDATVQIEDPFDEDPFTEAESPDGASGPAGPRSRQPRAAAP